jgi:O-antigen ligase
MPPILALSLWLVLTLALFRFDPAKESEVSSALWVPVILMFIIGSRNPSQWFGGGGGGVTAQSLEEGNPLDRVIAFSLILAAIGILSSRSFKWSRFFEHNISLTVFICFALLSVCWSDSSLIALKRWVRDLGNYFVVVVALSDPRPLEAVRTVLRRVFYLLVPLSILLDKYFPDMGRQFDYWSGAGYYVGATTSKNMLGVLCLISGLFFFWDSVTRWRERKQLRTKKILAANGIFFAMTVWLLNGAHSTTSSVCMCVGCMVVAMVHTPVFQRRPSLLKMLIPSVFCLYLILFFGFDMGGAMAGAVGKDPTLTDRTRIWAFVLEMHTNPLVGTGYESFWTGTRLEYFWKNAGLGYINEAHNGYLEVYLNLGLIGVGLLIGFMIASFRIICTRLKPFSSLASLTLALWFVMLLYSMTEAGFRGGLMWLAFLMGGIAIPAKRPRKLPHSIMNHSGFLRQGGSGTPQWPSVDGALAGHHQRIPGE